MLGKSYTTELHPQTVYLGDLLQNTSAKGTKIIVVVNRAISPYHLGVSPYHLFWLQWK